MGIFDQIPNLRDRLTPKWTPYIPTKPTPKQLAFLLLPQLEAFYGGAAGGGKSEALLMGALQYVDVPGYAAILFRKTFTDLKLPGSLISRSFLWLNDTPARWNTNEHTWYFPTWDGDGNPAAPATLSFGYIDSENAKYRYASSEYQYIAFDEVSQHFEDDYLFLFSRLRRLKNSSIPLRMRSASNPGGVGHRWVKKRFNIIQNPKDPNRYIGGNPERPYVAAHLEDNPHLDQESYERSLQQLDPVTRAQLLKGDWSVSQDSRFRREWFKYYQQVSSRWYLDNRIYMLSDFMRLFIIVDPAASVREGPGDKVIWKKEPSWSVISTFATTDQHDLIWVDLVRKQCEIPELIDTIGQQYTKWYPEFVGIEANGLGIGVFQMAARKGLPVRDLRPRGRDKLVRATDAMNRAEQGRVWIPQSAPWLDDLEGELFTWTGHPHEAADQIDTLSYAAMVVSWDSVGDEVDTYGQADDLPSVL